MTLLGAEGLIHAYGWEYLEAIFLGMPTMFVFFAFQSIRQGEGDTVTPMVLSGISVVLNVVLDPLFMFTFGMGIAGAAWATVARAPQRLGGYLLFQKERPVPQFRDLRFPRNFGISSRLAFPPVWGNPWRVSVHDSQRLCPRFGEYTVTAFGIGNTINSLILYRHGNWRYQRWLAEPGANQAGLPRRSGKACGCRYRCWRWAGLACA